jgi:hypothetical protein
MGEKLWTTRRTAQRYIQQLITLWIIEKKIVGRNVLVYIPKFIELLS